MPGSRQRNSWVVKVKVDDLVYHWRTGREGIVKYVSGDRTYMVISFDGDNDGPCEEWRRRAAFIVKTDFAMEPTTFPKVLTMPRSQEQKRVANMKVDDGVHHWLTGREGIVKYISEDRTQGMVIFFDGDNFGPSEEWKCCAVFKVGPRNLTFHQPVNCPWAR